MPQLGQHACCHLTNSSLETQIPEPWLRSPTPELCQGSRAKALMSQSSTWGGPGLCWTLLIWCLIAIETHAYPWLWTDQGKCGEQPAFIRAHGKRLVDRQIVFEISPLESLTGTVSRLCPGQTVHVKVMWPTNRYRALVTTSQGDLSAAAGGLCHRSSFTVTTNDHLEQSLQLPCDAHGEVLLEVSAAEEGGQLHYNSLTLQVDSSCNHAVCSQTKAHTAAVEMHERHPPVYHHARHGHTNTPHAASEEDLQHQQQVDGVVVRESRTHRPQQTPHLIGHAVDAMNTRTHTQTGQAGANGQVVTTGLVPGVVQGAQTQQHQQQPDVTTEGVREYVHQLTADSSQREMRRAQLQAKGLFQQHIEEQRRRRQQDLHRLGQASGVAEGHELRHGREEKDGDTVQGVTDGHARDGVQPQQKGKSNDEGVGGVQTTEQVWHAAGLEQQTGRVMPSGVRLPLATGSTGVEWKGVEAEQDKGGYEPGLPEQDEPEDRYTWKDGQQLENDGEEEGQGLMMDMNRVRGPVRGASRNVARKLLRAGWDVASVGHGLLRGKRAEL